MTFHLKNITAIRPFCVEAFVQREILVLESEDLVALHVRELLSTADGQNFALAFADLNSGNGGDSEIITSE